MCRISGFWDFSEHLSYAGEEVNGQMRDCMEYGGPDAAGGFFDDHLSLYLGHRRLSILDLSAAGNQPMCYKNWVLVFNGEVYNFQKIRTTLQQLGRTFQTQTDSEVILQAWEEWGSEAVERFRGMFAFAIWNTTKKTLTLCRDRLGVKPLYWYRKDNLFLFASELKSFHQHPKFDKTIAPKAVSLFLQQGYIPAPYCIFDHAHKLKPGYFLELDAQGNERTWSYWKAEEVYKKTSLDQRSEKIIQKDLEAILEESFQLRMVADVPVGLFLSGGIDSSLLAALLQKNSDRPLKTFTVGFENELYNEAKHAKAIAKHLGTEHTEQYCTQKEVFDLLARLPDFCDEPFGDTSVFPTHLVSAMARKEVKVALSADGADELFGGYTRYDVAYRWFPKIQKVPLSVRKLSAKMLGNIAPNWLEKNKNYFPILRQYKQLPHKLHKLQQALSAKNQLTFFVAAGAYNHQSMLQSFSPVFQNRYNHSDMTTKENQLLSLFGLIDIETYLEGDILTKVDRASMQVALEARDPFLDHKIVEKAMSLPDHLKIRGQQTKYLLRQILYQYVPTTLVDRPKQGFTVPMREWLSTHFQTELEQMAADDHFAQTFGLQSKAIQELVNAFTKGQSFVDHHLVWFLFVLFQWQKKWL